ncbi:hypothetical protein CPB86DRAFT_804216 [Serendipita vermifera]|nr:hypothetical protein CPB86DRAFT_804216 [Serendipita vermifera]
MSLIPSVKVTNGATLQRSYFTSDLFVNDARTDIDSLLCEFDHLAEGETEPFVIFKQLWVKRGWNLAHLIIWEDSARDQYFRTLFRLFIERINEKEEELIQAGALYALYTLFQLQNHVSGMQKVAHIEIALDTLEYLVSYAKLSGESVRHQLLYILQSFFSNGIFHVLPPSTLRPYNPTKLPHSFVTPISDPAPAHARGGRTKAEKDRAGRAKWKQLNEWVESCPTKYSALPQPTEYLEAKKAVVDALPDDLEKRAEQGALSRLKLLAKDASGSSEGVEIFENMVRQGRGILRDQWDQSEI